MSLLFQIIQREIPKRTNLWFTGSNKKYLSFVIMLFFFTNFRTNQITLTTNKDTRLVMNKIWSSLMLDRVNNMKKN